MNCWTNGSLLVVGMREQIAQRGGTFPEERPVVVLADLTGGRAAMAVYRLIQEAVPGFTADLSEPWREIAPETWLELWNADGTKVVVTAGRLVAVVTGVIADKVNGRWVLR